MLTKVNCLCSDIHYSSLLILMRKVIQGEFYQRLFMYSLWFPLGWVTAETALTSQPLPLHETYVINVWNVSPVFILWWIRINLFYTKCYLLLVCMYQTFRVGLIVKEIKRPYRSVTFLLASYPYHHLARPSPSRTFDMLYMVFAFCIGFPNI